MDNLSPIDRPFGWQQHVTLGPPFLAVGQSFYDMNGGWSIVDPAEFSKEQRLKQGGEFEWPNAPGAKGDTVDLRTYPTAAKNSDFTATLQLSAGSYRVRVTPGHGFVPGTTKPLEVVSG